MNGEAVTLNMYQTLGIAVLVLLLGAQLKKRISILEKFCIPSPVIGGLLYAGVMTVLYAFDVLEADYDDTLKNLCMVVFFTSVGFQANIRILKKGGVALLIFLGIVIALVFAQNGLSLGLAKLMGVDPGIGLSTGSIPMLGGHGTAAAFGPILEDFGCTGATSICSAAATFGLVMGSLMGGPVANRLVKKYDLSSKLSEIERVSEEYDQAHQPRAGHYAMATYQLAVAIGIGTIISWLLSLTGMTFPVYIGAMLAAAIIRNIAEHTKKSDVRMGEIEEIGGIALNLFLGIAMITLKLWQLASLALPLFVLLLGQTILMFIFARFIVFNLMGRDYDAAVLSAGLCGFGMGATPNAMANMQAITEKYHPSIKAFIIIPIVGSMFTDFINSLVTTMFINFL